MGFVAVEEGDLLNFDFAVEAEGAGDAGAFEGVALDEVEGIGGVEAGEAGDFGEVGGVLGLEVEVEDLGKDLGLIGDGGARGGDEEGTGDFFGGFLGGEEALDEFDAVVFEFRGLVGGEFVAEEGPGFDGFDLHGHDLDELFGDIVGGVAEREGFGGVNVKEDGDKHGGEDSVELLFGVDTLWIVLGLEWKTE